MPDYKLDYRLWEVPEQIEYLLTKLSEAETDEDRAKIELELELLDEHRDLKITATIQYISNLITITDNMDKAIKRLTERKARMNKKIDWLKNYLTAHSGGYVPSICPIPFYYQKRKKVIIQDEKQLPKWAFVIPEPKDLEPKLSINALEEVLKDGTELPGCTYEEVLVPVFRKLNTKEKDND